MTEMLVRRGGSREKAINYHGITGPVHPGDTVVLNTTAVRLGLGTGGYHFVLYNCSTTRGLAEIHQPGHIMKLRYTPCQLKVNCCEEEGNTRSKIEGFTSLDGVPVITGELHSMLAPACLTLKKLAPRARVVYVMTDTASLPLSFSSLVHNLRKKGLLEATVTCGQAFGGEQEAVNVYTGIISAVKAAGADAVLLFPGPGVVGTGTRYGFSGIEVGENINRILSLGGTPVAVPRLSFADRRSRHRGISHHTITSLTLGHVRPAYFPLPPLFPAQEEEVRAQLEKHAFLEKHFVCSVVPPDIKRESREKGVQLKSMGRRVEEDEAFFKAAAAAGKLGWSFLKRGKN